MEECTGGVVLADGMAPDLHLSATSRGIRLANDQESSAHPDRRQPDQLDVREDERQEQEGAEHKDHVMVDSRRRRTDAGPRRTGAESGQLRLSYFG